MLALDSVEFQYPNTEQSYRFSMHIEPGTIVCVSGRSGSGKSTLLDLIAGFQVPHSGTIHWQNTLLNSLPPAKRPVTTVFQRNNLFEHRNTIDNVVVGINPKVPKHGVDVDRAREALQSVGLIDHIHKQVSKLSGGQQQRVAIARALLRKSEVIMLDEPFSALDQTTKDDMRELVLELATQKNKAILLVTHDLDDCRSMANNHYVLENCQLNLQTS